MLPRKKRPRGNATASSPPASTANQRHRAAGQGQKGVTGMPGPIKGFLVGTSGLATVVFEDGSFAYIESGFGLRQLASAFGSLEAAVEQRIDYEADGLLMEWFCPLDGDSE